MDRPTYNTCKNIFGDGKTLQQTQSGVLLEIKTTGTTKDLMCYIFILLDASMEISRRISKN